MEFVPFSGGGGRASVLVVSFCPPFPPVPPEICGGWGSRGEGKELWLTGLDTAERFALTETAYTAVILL